MTRRPLVAIATCVLLGCGWIGIGVAANSPPEPTRLTRAGETYQVTVELEEARTGTIDVGLRIDPPTAEAVRIAGVMPEMGHSTPEVDADRTASGRFEARAELFSMTGAWELSVSVNGPAGSDILALPVLVDR